MEEFGASTAADSAEQLMSLEDEEFVRHAYVTILGRNADQEGFASYLDHLRRGMRKEEILVALATSPEGRQFDSPPLPGLKEIVNAAQRKRPSLLSRALARPLSGALRRIDKLNELMPRPFGNVEKAGGPKEARSADIVAHPFHPAATPKAVGHASLGVDEHAEPHRWPIYAQRSRLDRRRMNLERAFGRETVTDRFLYAVVSAVRLAADSRSVVAQFMEDEIVARWMLTGPATDRTFADVSIQLSALYYSAFTCSQVRRTAAEMDACNRVAARALVAEIWPTSYIDLPITAFMLCVVNAHYADTPDLQNPSKKDRICTEFFLKLVPKHGLERFVTSAQRNALCRSAGGIWEGKVSRLQSWILETDENLRSRFAPLDAPALAAFLTWFCDVGLWEMRLDFSLREEDLRASQMNLVSRIGDSGLMIPGYFGATGLLPDDLSPAETETWLHEMVWTRRYDTNFPRRIFAPSIFAYVANGRPAELYEPRASESIVQRLGLRRLRPGDLLVFCDAGNGPRHLIGRGWSTPEATHVWSTAQTALLAFNLDAADDGPLDLFLDFHVGPQSDARVTVAWNGQIMDVFRAMPNCAAVLCCSLGNRHQTGGSSNILGLSIDRLFSPSESGGRDKRTLGLALYKLALVQR